MGPVAAPPLSVDWSAVRHHPPGPVAGARYAPPRESARRRSGSNDIKGDGQHLAFVFDVGQ